MGGRHPHLTTTAPPTGQQASTQGGGWALHAGVLPPPPPHLMTPVTLLSPASSSLSLQQVCPLAQWVYSSVRIVSRLVSIATSWSYRNLCVGSKVDGRRTTCVLLAGFQLHFNQYKRQPESSNVINDVFHDVNVIHGGLKLSLKCLRGGGGGLAKPPPVDSRCHGNHLGVTNHVAAW